MKRILILSTKTYLEDSKSGFEEVMFQVARRYYERGDSVDWLGIGEKSQMYKGVNFVSSKNKLSLFLNVFKYYLVNRNNTDIVIEFINGDKTFAPLFFSNKKIVTILGDMQKSVRNKTMMAVPAMILNFVDKYVFRFFYNSVFITFSNSIKEELLNFVVNQDINVLNPAVTNSNKYSKRYFKRENLLVSTVDDMGKDNFKDQLYLINELKTEVPDIRLAVVINQANVILKERIEKLVSEYDINTHVKILNCVDQKSKDQVLKHAYIYITCAFSDGLSFDMKKAELFGTPSIGYSNPGIVDQIRHHKNGLLTYENTPKAMKNLVVRLLEDKRLYDMLSEECTKSQKRITYDEMFNRLNFVLDTLVRGKVNIAKRLFL